VLPERLTSELIQFLNDFLGWLDCGRVRGYDGLERVDVSLRSNLAIKIDAVAAAVSGPVLSYYGDGMDDHHDLLGAALRPA